MTNADIIAILRDQYNLDSTKYPDALLTKYITRSCQMISNYYPAKELNHLHAVKDQSRYSVTHTNLIKLLNVYYNSTIDPETTNIFDSRELFLNRSDTYQLSQNYEFLKRLESLKSMSPVDAEIIDHDHFELIPPPELTGIPIYYEYARVRAITEMPISLQDEIIACVFYFIEDDSYKKTTVADFGNKYNFDRRGNTKVDNQQATTEMRQTEYKNLINSIKLKVMSVS